MSKKKEGAPEYDPEAQYLVKLNRVATLENGTKLLPPNRNVVKGKLIAELGDAVESAELVPDA